MDHTACAGLPPSCHPAPPHPAPPPLRPRPRRPRSVVGLAALRTLLLGLNFMTARPFLLPGPYLPRLAMLGLSDLFDEESGVSAGWGWGGVVGCEGVGGG